MTGVLLVAHRRPLEVGALYGPELSRPSTPLREPQDQRGVVAESLLLRRVRIDVAGVERGSGDWVAEGVVELVRAIAGAEPCAPLATVEPAVAVDPAIVGGPFSCHRPS